MDQTEVLQNQRLRYDNFPTGDSLLGFDMG